ncbi:hypothetical protein D917_03336 [Trichinella nativa]|uniref:Uncharacterized protein n=1 Tax=Trichinella nativa TaxID=6335 RepID=A0A1Y3E8N0_9BILA|nr:hypothetical protein D917_03336 [Trichinella nativa]
MTNTNSTLNCEVYCIASYQLQLYQVIIAHWMSGSGQMRRREAFLFKVVVGWLGNGNRRKRKQSYKSRPLH